MRFGREERALLLAVRGVGPGVVRRLEEIGIASLPALAGRDAAGICAEVAAMLGTSCWRNAPKARAAIEAAIGAARAATAPVAAGGAARG